jgi:FkbM family methyltransferase
MARRVAARAAAAFAVLLALQGVACKSQYSEFDQDEWVLSLFPDRKGFYVDTGAWHTELASNSKLLDEHGWTGVCIEPFGSGFDQRSCSHEPYVVSDYPGQLVKYQVAGPFAGVRSTISTEQWAEYKAEYQKGSVRVKTTTTLGDVLKRANAPSFIEFLSIDVEGHEVQVLKGIPFWKYTFGAITVDTNKEADKAACIRSLLEYHGYSFARELGQDYAFVRNITQVRPEHVSC